MNFFTKQGATKIYNTYTPHKFDNENFRNSRDTNNLYDFPKKNPFDQNIDWKELTKHYENGTLNHDYKITYKPVLENLKLGNMGSNKLVEEKENNITNKDIGNDNLQVSAESALCVQTLKKQSPLFKNKHINLTKTESSTNTKINRLNDKFQTLNTFSEKPVKSKKFNFESKNPFFLNSGKISKLKNKISTDQSRKEKKKGNFYKKIMYTTTACSAVISTVALVTTATLFAPLLPTVLPFLLPVSIASNGIILFKVKRVVSKTKKKICIEIQKFKINTTNYRNSRKFYSQKPLFKNTKLKELFRQKKQDDNKILVNNYRFLSETEIETILKDTTYEKTNPFKYENLSTVDNKPIFSNSDISSKKQKQKKTKKRDKKKIDKPIFQFLDSSDEEQKDIDNSKCTSKSSILEKYLKPECIKQTNDLKIVDNLSEKEHPNIKPDSSNESQSGSKSFICNLNSFPMQSPSLETVKKTAIDFCDYFKPQ